MYRQTRDRGLYRGLVALAFRWSNCRAGYQVFEHPGEGVKRMMLPGGRIIDEPEIAERLLL
ncbi:hypothetical protein HDC91_001108 [Mucilaginibacter sp. AK015]|nr:hypothetical protein [Mucilaginibacter sp. AK015]